MATSQLLVLPEQDILLLQSEAQSSPYFANLLRRFPSLSTALAHPLPDQLECIVSNGIDAVDKVRENTNYPEDWDALEDALTALHKGLTALKESKSNVEEETSNIVSPTACPCCGGVREASVYAKACNSNFTLIPHLGIEHDGYMVSNVGIPGDGDGPGINVCLDCGRIKNQTYPVADETILKATSYLREDQ